MLYCIQKENKRGGTPTMTEFEMMVGIFTRCFGGEYVEIRWYPNTGGSITLPRKALYFDFDQYGSLITIDNDQGYE